MTADGFDKNVAEKMPKIRKLEESLLSSTSGRGTPTAGRRSSRTHPESEISGEGDRKEGNLRVSQERNRDRTETWMS